MPGFAWRKEKSRVMPRTRKYPIELLARATRAVFGSGRPIAHVAADLGIPTETLRKHVRRVEVDTGRRIAAVSGSSRSSGPWTCRRPPIIGERAVSARSVRVRMSGCSIASASCTLQLLRLPVQADVESAAAGWRAGRAQPRRATEARPRYPRCEAPRQALADGQVGPDRGAPPRSRRP
jgi:transposase-like protein